MDLRDHQIRWWHDYNAIGGEDECAPFLVSSRGYGLVWDNPSKTIVDLGLNGRNVWSSEVGDRVSYLVIVGQTTDEVFAGYRLLTGVRHMLPSVSFEIEITWSPNRRLLLRTHSNASILWAQLSSDQYC